MSAIGFAGISGRAVSLERDEKCARFFVTRVSRDTAFARLKNGKYSSLRLFLATNV